ncbi:hypothetical protein AB4Y88_18770 [Paenarthrobacter sp. RAF9]
MQVPEGALDAVMAGLTASPNVDGILVTMPHKHAAFPYCSTSTDRASRTGVVSVMRRNPDGSWHGDMLDGLAFVKAKQDHGATIHGSRAFRPARRTRPTTQSNLSKGSFARTVATGRGALAEGQRDQDEERLQSCPSCRWVASLGTWRSSTAGCSCRARP